MTQAQNKERFGYEQARAQMDAISETVRNLLEMDEDYTEEEYEAAVQRIQEDALYVEVRSGWTNPDEYRIVLCTGGQNVEIRGDLDSTIFEPTSAHLHYADQDESGEYLGDNLDTDALLIYAQQFFFG